MTNSNSDTQLENTEAGVETPDVETVETVEVVEAAEPQPEPEFQPLDLKRRLRELLSVPERDRSDEQWDEIIELEIQLAPGNRIAGGPAPGGGGGQPRHNTARQNKPAGGNAPAQQKKHRPRSKNNRRPRQGGKPGGGEAV